jgi:hypothetical protein
VKQPGSPVSEFWDEKLTEIIAEQLDKRKDGRPRHRGRLEESVQRHVVFRDTRGRSCARWGMPFTSSWTRFPRRGGAGTSSR